MTRQQRTHAAVAALAVLLVVGALLLPGLVTRPRPQPVAQTPLSQSRDASASPSDPPRPTATRSAGGTEPTTRTVQAPPTGQGTHEASPDTTAPSPPTGLALGPVNEWTFTLLWQESSDDRGVRHYLVLVNGEPVATTVHPRAELPWPPGSGTFLVQVAAVDEAGNRSPWTAGWVVPPDASMPTSGPTTVGTTATGSSEPSAPPTTIDPGTPVPTDAASSTPTPTLTPDPTPDPTPTPTPCPTDGASPVPCAPLTPTLTAPPDPTTTAAVLPDPPTPGATP